MERFHHWLARRLDGVPLAYLTGEKEFFGLTLRVTPDTLIPRPDTELLVQWALERLEGPRPPRVVDLGTGTGAIALSIKSQRPDADVRMVDFSPGALAVAGGRVTTPAVTTAAGTIVVAAEAVAAEAVAPATVVEAAAAVAVATTTLTSRVAAEAASALPQTTTTSRFESWASGEYPGCVGLP